LNQNYSQYKNITTVNTTELNVFDDEEENVPEALDVLENEQENENIVPDAVDEEAEDNDEIVRPIPRNRLTGEIRRLTLLEK
jgi:vacuolar-type H+-ATPase catalytic subunit A/Vma1